MNILDIKKELNLLYFNYDELNKVFLIKPNHTKNPNALNEFTQIVTKLSEYKIDYEILNSNCILIKTEDMRKVS